MRIILFIILGVHTLQCASTSDLARVGYFSFHSHSATDAGDPFSQFFKGELNRRHPAFLRRHEVRPYDEFWNLRDIQGSLDFGVTNWPFDHPGPSTAGPAFWVVQQTSPTEFSSETADMAIIHEGTLVTSFYRYHRSAPSGMLSCVLSEHGDGLGYGCYCDTMPFNYSRRSLWRRASNEECKPSPLLERWVAHIGSIVKASGATYATPVTSPLIKRLFEEFEKSSFSR